MMKLTQVILLVLSSTTTTTLAARDPTWADWEYVRDYFIDRIVNSTCPDAGDAALVEHWDYNYTDRIAAGETHDEALQGDCILFHRFRNPSALGTRLIRHAFHDAAGGFNGFVNIHDLVENPGLHATTQVLEEDYDLLEVPNTDGSTVPIKRILGFADFTAWACHAALLRTVSLQNRTAIPGRYVEAYPHVEVRYGRPTYEPISAADTGPTEYFPTGLSAQGTGQLIVEYFAGEFGFTADETTTIMGAHTLGGARREDSGFAGMWTQSKGKFNNDYQKQLVFPLPLFCAGGPDNCDYFSVAENDILAASTQKQTCKDGEDSDRCHGWEQTKRAGYNGASPKFQWMHSCKDDGTGCTHLMLNIDIGLFYDLEGHICTKEDELAGVAATAGRTCLEGMIKSYPADSTCDVADARVLATCFNPNPTTQTHITTDADNMDLWIEDFGPLFDKLLTHKMLNGVTVDQLTVLTPPAICENDPDWTYTFVKPGGATNEKNCRFVAQRPADRCSETGTGDVLASVACCAACESVVDINRGVQLENGQHDDPYYRPPSEEFVAGAPFTSNAVGAAMRSCWGVLLLSSTAATIAMLGGLLL